MRQGIGDLPGFDEFLQSDEVLRADHRSEKFSLRMKDRRLDHAFALVLFLRGLRAEVDGADLRVLR
jgi:hypothetical protein